MARPARRSARRSLPRPARTAGAVARHRVIDLAIAQVAGLGVIAAHTAGFEIAGWTTQIAAVCSALLAALLLTWTERKRPEAQEALIGVLFVLASTAQILLLANDPHGGEELRDLLVGQILFIDAHTLVPAAVLAALVLVSWKYVMRTLGRAGFYVLFAISVTASVQLVGVYLVLASLMVPALATAPAQARLIGYVFAFSSYVLGLWCSAVVDLPSSAVIVWVMALIGIVVHAARRNGEARSAQTIIGSVRIPAARDDGCRGRRRRRMRTARTTHQPAPETR